MFTLERLISDAMRCFGAERLITVLMNSPLHTDEVAVVELCTVSDGLDGAIKLADLVSFAAYVNLTVDDVFIKERNSHCTELWLVSPSSKHEWDDDPTPVSMLV